MSLNKLFEEFSTKALAKFDSEVRFKARAVKGDVSVGIDLLGKLDNHYRSE